MPKWFEIWFDSPYYHLLYGKHDRTEAHHMIDNLLSTMQMPPRARILDLACGKGRHAVYLADKGFDVTGLDISASSIAYARRFEQEGLSFYQHDMRNLFRTNYFDAVVNLFTSFGYFDREEEHLRVMQNISKELKPGGLLLLDYFNSRWVRSHLVPSDEKTVRGIHFRMRRRIDDGHVLKSIEFEAEGRSFAFQEKVRLFDLQDFEALAAASDLEIFRTFGSYDLEPFQPEHSKRLILLARKPETHA